MLVEGLESKDWAVICDSLNDVRRYAIFQSDLVLPVLDKVIAVVVKAMKNRRSTLCKTSIMASSDVLTTTATSSWSSMILGHLISCLRLPSSYCNNNNLGCMKRTTSFDQEEEEGSPRKKLRLTKHQSDVLEDSFKHHFTLNTQALAKQLNLRPRQVEVWFQNRRARTKLKQTEMECDELNKQCEKLTEDNKRLQKELHELKNIQLFRLQLAFDRNKFMEVLGSGDNVKADIETFLATFLPLLQVNHKFLAGVGLDDLKAS